MLNLFKSFLVLEMTSWVFYESLEFFTTFLMKWLASTCQGSD